MEQLILQMAEMTPVFMLVLARTLALSIQTPYIGSQAVPMTVRVSIGVSLALFYLLSKPNLPTDIPEGFLPYMLLIIQEVLVGVLFGFAASVIISAIQVGGEIIDVQVGLSMVMLFNPQTKTQTTAMGRFFYQIALIVLVTSNAHLFLLKVYFETFDILPIGTFSYRAGTGINELIKITSDIFVYGAQIALPIVVVIFVTDFGLGMMNRVAPQINILELNFAMKPTTGALIVMMMFTTMISVMADFSHRMAQNAKSAISAVAEGIEQRQQNENRKKLNEKDLPPGFPQELKVK